MPLDAPATLLGGSETSAMIARARRAARTPSIPWITSAHAGRATIASRHNAASARDQSLPSGDGAAANLVKEKRQHGFIGNSIVLPPAHLQCCRPKSRTCKSPFCSSLWAVTKQPSPYAPVVFNEGGILETAADS
eukprot:s1862_g4.t1